MCQGNLLSHRDGYVVDIDDADIEALLVKYYKKVRKESIGQPKGPCVTDVVIVAFLYDALTGEALKTFTDHVICCDRCAELVKDHLLIIKGAEREPWPEVPSHLVDKAMALMKQNLSNVNQKGGPNGE